MCWIEWNFFSSNFYFSSHCEKFNENWGTKMTKTRKIKIGKIWNLIFLSIQHIPHLSCKFEHFWKKELYFLVKYWIMSSKLNYQHFHPSIKCKMKIIAFIWKIRNRLNRKKNQISDFSNFYFLSYDNFCTKFSMNFSR